MPQRPESLGWRHLRCLIHVFLFPFFSFFIYVLLFLCNVDTNNNGNVQEKKQHKSLNSTVEGNLP